MPHVVSPRCRRCTFPGLRVFPAGRTPDSFPNLVPRTAALRPYNCMETRRTDCATSGPAPPVWTYNARGLALRGFALLVATMVVS